MDDNAQRKRRRRRNQDLDVLQAIEEMANVEQLPAAKIHTALQERFGNRAPASPRTTQDIVREMRMPDASEAWALLDAEPGEARLMLDVIGEIATRTDGRRVHLTRREADAILLVDAAVPGLPSWEKYRIARVYQQRRDRGVGATDVDLLLAYMPWLGDERRKAYRDAIQANRIPQPPLHLFAALATAPGERFVMAPGSEHAGETVYLGALGNYTGPRGHEEPAADSGTNARTTRASSEKGSK